MSQKTILFVDDEEGIRLVVATCLEDAGYRVLTAIDAPAGFQLATAESPDLIISDVMMPGESGYSMCERLKADPATRQIPLIFLTVMDDEATGLSVGATAFLCKPFEEEELLKTVSDVLNVGESGQHLDEALQDIRSNDLASGVQKLLAMVDSDPDNPMAIWARYYRAQAQQTRGEVESARDELEKIVMQDAAFWRAHNRLGMLLEDSEPAKAMQHYQRSLSLNPVQPDINERLANLR